MKAFCVFILMFLVGCSIYPELYTGNYVVSLQKVEITNNQKESSIENFFNSDNRIIPNFTDSLIDVQWFIGSTQMEFILRNKTSKTMWILWDDAVFIDTIGYSNRVIHKNIKILDVANSQVPSPVASNSKISDLIIPIDNIDIGNIKPLFDYSTTDSTYLQKIKIQNVGKTFGILLPVKSNNVTNDYVFTFQIDDFIYDIPKKKLEPKPKRDLSDPIYN